MSATDHFPNLPKPPYYAVIFSSLRSKSDLGYDAMSARMIELAMLQPGYLGVESVRNAHGYGITVSYWQDEASILAWRRHAEHKVAQETGQTHWYEHYDVRIAKVERTYSQLNKEAAI